MRTFRSSVVAPAGLLLLTPLITFATPITGTLNITGDSIITNTSLSFLCDIGGVPCSTGTSGAARVTALSTGDFQQFGNDTAVVKDLSLATQPINAPFTLDNWITFNVATPGVSITLNMILPGTFGQTDCLAAPAAGQTCTPVIPALVTPANPQGLSPFNLSNTQSGSIATFTLMGTAVNTNTGETSQVQGVFSETFTGSGANPLLNGSYQYELAQLVATGSVTAPFSATLTAIAPVPEPASWSFMIGGLMLFGAAVLRRVVSRQE